VVQETIYHDLYVQGRGEPGRLCARDASAANLTARQPPAGPAAPPHGHDQRLARRSGGSDRARPQGRRLDHLQRQPRRATAAAAEITLSSEYTSGDHVVT
jgi:hypothetical protein